MARRDNEHDRGREQERGREKGESERDSDKSSHESRGKSDDANLKEREYRDADGNVHHHTNAYMEQHKGERDD